jgi:GrpB-like predicted nucleotidyltransferase (UPF0157 family)
VKCIASLIDEMVDPKDDPIEIVPSRYEEWNEHFMDERDRVHDVLVTHNIASHVERIEHVGSTAVTDLAAKDIVDLDIIVADNAVADILSVVTIYHRIRLVSRRNGERTYDRNYISRVLEAELGGDRFENTSEWHPVFRVDNGQRFNDHVFAVSSEKWKISVVTRDVLRTHPILRAEYEQLKHTLASEHDDLVAYSEGKTEFVMRVLKTARENDNQTFDFSVPDKP